MQNDNGTLSIGELLNQLSTTGQAPLQQQYAPYNSQPQTSQNPPFDIPWESLSPPVVGALRNMQSKGISLFSPSSVLLYQSLQNQKVIVETLHNLINLIGELHNGETSKKEEKSPKTRKRIKRTRNN